MLQCYWGCFPYFNYKVLSWHSGIALDHPEYFFVCSKEHNLIIPLTYYVHLPRQFWLYHVWSPIAMKDITTHPYFVAQSVLLCLGPKANNFVANFLGRADCVLCWQLLVGEVWENVSESKQFSFYLFDSCCKMKILLVNKDRVCWAWGRGKENI